MIRGQRELGRSAAPGPACARAIPRATAQAPQFRPSSTASPSIRRRRRRGASTLAATTTTTTTPPAPTPTPPAALLPTRSRFDPTIERVVPPWKSSPNEQQVREGYWEWEGKKIRYTRAGPFCRSSDGSGGGGGDDASRPLLVLVHGFGGNADHWRKNLPVFAEAGCDVAAIDLLGYGYSSKPDPKTPGGHPNEVYSMENWARQILDFVRGPCGCSSSSDGDGDGDGDGKNRRRRRAFLITNSIGGIAALQAAVYAAEEALAAGGQGSTPPPPPIVAGVQLMDVSLRMLHESKQPPLARPLVSALQTLLRETPLGAFFFGSVAKPATVSKILKEAYGDDSAVDDELVDVILKPGLEPGATSVFLDFISYSGGPLAEELLSKLSKLNDEIGNKESSSSENKKEKKKAIIPVSILWGEADPWEKVEWGAELAAQAASSDALAREWRARSRGGGSEGGSNGGGGNSAVARAEGNCVEEFVPLPGCGHCPHDEAPDVVNPLVLRFVRRHAAE